MIRSPPRFLEQCRQSQFDVRDDAQFDRHHASDLRRFDVDVDELPLAAIYPHLAVCRSVNRQPKPTTRSDSKKIAVPDGLPNLDSGVAGIQRVVVGKPALSHVRHDDGQ